MFGKSAMYFDGTGDYLSIPDSDDFDFGNGDFTIDTWFKRESGIGVNPWIITSLDTSMHESFGLRIIGDRLTGYFWSNESGNKNFNSSSQSWDYDWHHVALVRN